MSSVSKLCLVCLLVAGAGAFASAATAARSPTVSGTWSVTPQIPTGLRQAGVNLELSGVSSSTWAGDFIGTTVAQTRFVIHADGSIVGAPVREAFTGTVAGVGTGTLDFAEEAHAQPDGSSEIGATIVGGTGDLGNLHGRLTFVGTCDLDGACAGGYSGQLRN